MAKDLGAGGPTEIKDVEKQDAEVSPAWLMGSRAKMTKEGKSNSWKSHWGGSSGVRSRVDSPGAGSGVSGVKMSPSDAQERWSDKMRMSQEALDCLEHGDCDSETFSSHSTRCQDTILTFKDIAFEVIQNNGQKKEILAPISGHFESGHLAAIMGPSGCGKTTLLDILAGQKSGTYSGTVHFNGRPRDKLFPRISAYVPQEDEMPKYLTVSEAVEFNGMLKFERPSLVSRKMAQQWILRRLEVLGLMEVKDTYIGDATSLRGISGGQKRRLSLAKRLTSGAQVFFCDEPTSGLSATDAETCMRYMKHIAQFYNVIVVVVIHQPRVEVAKLFDELLLMTAGPGRAVYNGKMEDVVGYLLSNGFEVPMHANPVDYFMDLVTPEVSTSQVDLFLQKYSEQMEDNVLAVVDEGLKAEMPSALELLENIRAQMLKWGRIPALRNSKYGVRFRRQLYYVFKRQLKLRWRDQNGLLADLLGGVIKALVVGIVYMQTGELDVKAQVSFFFMLCMSVAIDGLKNMPTVISERTIVKTEVAEVLYSDWAYIISFTFLSLLQEVVVHSIFVAIIFAMSGLRWTMFSSIYLWTTLLAVTMDAMYLMVAAVAKDSTTAIIMSAPFMMLFLLFNGFTSTRSSVVPWMRWAIEISPVAYAIQQITFTAMWAYEDNDGLNSSYNYIVTTSDYQDQPIRAVAVIASCFAVFKIIQMVCFHCLNNIRR